MLYCRICSSTALPGYRYCGKCGTKLEWRFSGRRKVAMLTGVAFATLVWFLVVSHMFRESMDHIPQHPIYLAFVVIALTSILTLVLIKRKKPYLIALFTYIITMLCLLKWHGFLHDLFMEIESVLSAVYSITFPAFFASIGLLGISLILELKKDSKPPNSSNTGTK